MVEKRKLLRRIGLGLTGLLVTLTVVLVAALFLLSSPVGEKILRGFLEARLRPAIQQEVRIGNLETNLFSRLQIRDVHIYSEEDGRTMSLLRLRRASVKYRLWDILRSRITIKGLEVDSLTVHIRRDSLGQLNLPIKKPAAESTSETQKRSFSLHIENVLVQGAGLMYEDVLIPADASISNLTLRVALEPGDVHDLRVNIDSVWLVYKGLPVTIQTIGLQGQWSDRNPRLESFSMELPGLSLTGNAEVVRDSVESSVAGRLLVQGDPGELLHDALRSISGRSYPAGGNLELSLEIAGSLDQPEVKVSLDMSSVDVGDYSVRNGLILASWKPGHIDLESLGAEVLGGSVTGSGEVDMDSLLRHSLVLKAENIDLAQVWETVYSAASSYQGKIAGQLTSGGRGTRPEDLDVDCELLLHKLNRESLPVPDISTQLRLERGIASFDFRQKDSRAVAEARLVGDEVSGKFSAVIPKLAPLAELLNVPELDGGVQCSGTLAGTTDSPRLHATVEGRDLRFRNFPIDSLWGDVVYTDNQLNISTLHVEGELASIDTLRPPFRLSGLGGGFHYEATARGPTENLKADVAVDLFRPAYGDFGFDRGHVGVTMRDREVHLASLQLVRDSVAVNATGRYSLSSREGSLSCDFYLHRSHKESSASSMTELEAIDWSDTDLTPMGNISGTLDVVDTGLFSLEVKGDQLEIDRIVQVLPSPPDVGGVLRFDLDLQGSRSNPLAGLKFLISRPRYQLAQLDSIRGDVRFAGDEFVLKHLEIFAGGHSSWAEAGIQLKRREDGTYFVSSESAISGQAHGREFDIRLLVPLLPPGMQVSGYGSYDLSWQGTKGSPHVVGSFALRDGLVEPGETRPAVQAIQIKALLEDSVLVLENASGKLQEIPWRIHGRISAKEWQALDLQMALGISDISTVTASGRVSADSLRLKANVERMDLSVMQPFLPTLEGLSGRCSTDLLVYGPSRGPEIDGTLAVRGLGFRVAGQQEAVTKGVVKIGFDKRNVRIDSVFVVLNGGGVLVSGELTHDVGQINSLDVRAAIHNVKIDRPNVVVVNVRSAQLDYSKQNSHYLLNGDVVLGESRFVYRFKPQSLLSLARSAERPKAATPTMLQQTRLNVRLRESENIWIDNNLAHLRLHSELSFIGNLAQPNLTGRLQAEEGYVLYLDRKFQVEQGVLDFIDPHRVNPIVDLKAQATLKSYQTLEKTPYTITFALSGPLDQTIFELTSDPPLDKSDILALLTVGATRAQLAGKDSEGKTSSVGEVLRERAALLSSQRISGYASRKVGNLLGLEEVSIEGNLFQFGRSWGPQLLASKKISDRVAITYSTTVGHLNEQSIRLDYRLSKYFSVQGQTDQRGRSALDLKYGLKFK